MIAAALIGVVVLVGMGVLVFRGHLGLDAPTDDNNPSTSATASPSAAPGESGSGSATPSSSAPAVSPGGTVEPAALPSMLESIASLNEKYKANLIPAAGLATEPFSGLMVTPGAYAGAILPGIDYVYRSANYSGFSGQLLTDEATRTKIMQAVIAFNTETEATRFFNDRFTAWKSCADITITADGGGTHSTIQTGSISETEGIASISMWPVGDPTGNGATLRCERSMTPRKNVIVDVRVCVKDDATTLGEELARSISQKVADTP
ncbi:sensor domain-containing protein [Mycolicibacterium farcinogenes]|nr:sensor domain-containing protein [Mycolicibacterium farcinogenes]